MFVCWPVVGLSVCRRGMLYIPAPTGVLVWLIKTLYYIDRGSKACRWRTLQSYGRSDGPMLIVEVGLCEAYSTVQWMAFRNTNDNSLKVLNFEICAEQLYNLSFPSIFFWHIPPSQRLSRRRSRSLGLNLPFSHRIQGDDPKLTFCNGTVLHKNQVRSSFGDWLNGILDLSRHLHVMELDVSAFSCLAALSLVYGR